MGAGSKLLRVPILSTWWPGLGCWVGIRWEGGRGQVDVLPGGRGAPWQGGSLAQKEASMVG